MLPDESIQDKNGLEDPNLDKSDWILRRFNLNAFYKTHKGNKWIYFCAESILCS